MKEEFNFLKDNIFLYSGEDMKKIKKNIEDIFRRNEKMLPKNKNAKILIKPNFNNDLNSLTGNSTDLRVLVAILTSLRQRKYKNIIIGEGPNCGVNHIGIDVFARLGIDKIVRNLGVKLVNFNKTEGEKIKLTTSEALISEFIQEADFIIDVPTIKTHMEAGITVSCKNYMGCLLGTEKRKMHDNLHENIVKLNEIIKTDLIIVDGLMCMEGNGPGDGIPKEMNMILSGHNTFLVDLVCSRIMGIPFQKIPFLQIALKKGILSREDKKISEGIDPISIFIPAKKNLFGKIFLNNFFINIRFMKPFQKIFDKGFVPWFLFKLGVRQDVYIHKEKDIKKFYEKEKLNKTQKEELKKCLKKYCPMSVKRLGDKKCIRCMYCYQKRPDLIDYEGDLGSFEMQIKRFGKFINNGR